jgi:hypothetical protein
LALKTIATKSANMATFSVIILQKQRITSVAEPEPQGAASFGPTAPTMALNMVRIEK